MKRYVITGGPGVGKTTLINILASRGYTVVPEAPRILIEEYIKVDTTFSPLNDPQKFQKEVIDRQIELESKITEDVVFCDRGLIDNYGYSIFYKMPVPEILQTQGSNRYDKIFLLDPLPQYETDTSRYEDKETALAIHNAIEDGYRKYRYEIIKVPVLTPEQRTDFILAHL